MIHLFPVTSYQVEHSLSEWIPHDSFTHPLFPTNATCPQGHAAWQEAPVRRLDATGRLLSYQEGRIWCETCRRWSPAPAPADDFGVPGRSRDRRIDRERGHED